MNVRVYIITFEFVEDQTRVFQDDEQWNSPYLYLIPIS